MATSRVSVNKPLSRRPIQQLNRALLVGLRRAGRAGLLERGTKRGALGTITSGGRNRLPMVLGRGCNSWQGKTPVMRKTVLDTSREA